MVTVICEREMEGDRERELHGFVARSEYARWCWCEGADAIVVCQVSHHPNNSKSPKPPPPSSFAIHHHPHLTQLIRFHTTPHQKPISNLIHNHLTSDKPRSPLSSKPRIREQWQSSFSLSLLWMTIFFLSFFFLIFGFISFCSLSFVA